MKAAHGGWLACSLVALIFTSAAGAAQGVSAILDTELPSGFESPTDVRWLDDSTLLISDPASGVLELDVSGDLTSAPFAENLGRFRRWVHLAVSPSHVAGAYIAFNAWWQQRDEHRGSGSLSLDYVADLDLHAKRLLVAGLRRDDDGTLGADGAMAWLVDLGQEEMEPRPVLPLPGNALQALQDCATALLPKARFMADGAFVLVPGVQPGIFFYDSSARLTRTWETDSLGLDQDCRLSDEQKHRFNTDVGLRQGWLNGRRVIDEVLPLPTGPGLLVRSRADGVTRWQLLRLTDEEGPGTRRWRSAPLSVTSPSPWLHASGDVRGERLAVLLAPTAPEKQGAPRARLLLFALQP